MSNRMIRNVRLGKGFDKKSYKLGVIIPFRYSEDREDAIDRLNTLLSHDRDRRVQFYVVDSGSPLHISKKLEQICSSNKINYIYADTRHEIFSIGKARDIGAIYANADYLFFQDIDLLGYEGFYNDLINEIQVQDLEKNNEDFLMVPCVYLTENGSGEFLNCDKKIRKSKFIQYLFEGNKDIYINFAAGSSAILVNRLHYLSVGGHDNEFQGHGFEDFELIHRLASINKKFHRPFKYYEDFKKWDPIEYLGFRSFYRLFGETLMNKGIYLFHIWHKPVVTNSGYTSKNKDNKTLLVNKMKAFDKTKQHPSPLPDIYAGKTLALGAEGNAFYKSLWQIIPSLGMINFKSEHDFEDEKDFIKYFNKGNYDRVIMPNPYGNEKRLSLYKVCKEQKFKMIISDRGALMDSVFFDPHGFNADSISYNESNWNKPLSASEEQVVLEYLNQQYMEDSALEEQGERIGAEKLEKKLNVRNKKVLFVPFQRPSDTVIKYFAGPIKDMDNFVAFIEELAEQLDEDWTIVAKKHPLETTRPIAGIQFVEDDTHIKDLIELADAVLLINSGVGLQSMMWYKPVFYMGEAFYGIEGVNKQITTIKELKSELNNLYTVNPDKVHRFLYFLINNFYSFGKTRSEVVTRKDGSMFNVTREIEFRYINLPDAQTRSYIRRESPIVPFSAPILDRYRVYFNKVAQERKKTSTKQVTKSQTVKPTVANVNNNVVSNKVSNKVSNNQVSKKEESKSGWAFRQFIKLCTKPRTFFQHLNRWNEIKRSNSNIQSN